MQKSKLFDCFRWENILKRSLLNYLRAKHSLYKTLTASIFLSQLFRKYLTEVNKLKQKSRSLFVLRTRASCRVEILGRQQLYPLFKHVFLVFPSVNFFLIFSIVSIHRLVQHNQFLKNSTRQFLCNKFRVISQKRSLQPRFTF